jgi:hypothetical protein
MATEATGTEAFESLDVLIVPSPILSDDETDFPEIDPATGLYIGGRVRLEAAAEFSLRHQPRWILVVGGIHPQHSTRLTAAMRQFILKKNARANVRPVNSLPCTRHNVIALFNQLGRELEHKRLAVLTNEYHLPRFRAFWSQLRDEYKLAVIDPLPIAAETIWKSRGGETVNDALEARHETEERGLVDLRAGKYVDRCLGQLASFGAELVKHPGQYLSRQERTTLGY